MKWFNDQKITVKLFIGFIFVSIITLVIGYIGINSMNSIAESSDEMYNHMTVPIAKLGNIQQRFHRVRINTRDMIIANDPAEIKKFDDKIKEYSAVITQEVEAIDKLISTDEAREAFRKFNESRVPYRKDLQELFDLAYQNKDAEAFAMLQGDMKTTAMNEQAAIEKLVDQFLKEANNKSVQNNSDAQAATTMMIVSIVIGIAASVFFGYLISNMIRRSAKRVLEMAQELCKGHVKARAKLDSKDELGEMGRALDQFAYQVEEHICGGLNRIADGDAKFEAPIFDKDDAVSPALNRLAKTLNGLIEEVNGLTTAAVEGDLEKRGNADRFNGGYKEIVAGFNATIDTIVKNLRDYEKVIEKVGHGDLTARMVGDYKGNYKKLQNNANQFAESLYNLISEVNQAVHATASAASEISSSSEQMAAGSHEQSQQTSEIASAVEQMAKTIIETTEHITQASQISKNASASANNGTVKIEETKKGMERIVAGSSQTAEVISSLSKKTDQIGEITQVIDDIADQTNLLALNAAIEAARAGEQGRGFAVVADEVRKLAERTTKATKEIAETIKAIQVEAKQADSSMLEAKALVEDGMKLTEEVDSALREIVKGSARVSDVVGQVAAASEEQSSTAEQISKNIEGISSVTQQSAAGTEQIARAAEDLNRLTVNLQELISRFKLDENESNMSSNFTFNNRNTIRNRNARLLEK
ncbi:MAG: methyl-accepting chemotaxis protein [Bacillota bacterium]